MYFVGSTVSDVALTTRNAAGTPETDAGVVFTVTKSDGTTSTPATTNPSTGVYQALYVTTQAGRHFWSATTTSHGPQSGVFNVEPLASTAIVSLADVKSHLNIVSTTDDEELRSAILAASEWVESKIGPVARRTFSQVVRGRGAPIILDNAPVISVTSVTPAGGVAFDALTLDVDLDAGLIYPAYGSTWPTYSYGATTVVYVAGRPVVPEPVQWAVKEYVAWLWDTQRGPAQASPAQADLADQLATGTFATVPRRIEQALEPYALAPAVA